MVVHWKIRFLRWEGGGVHEKAIYWGWIAEKWGEVFEGGWDPNAHWVGGVFLLTQWLDIKHPKQITLGSCVT